MKSIFNRFNEEAKNPKGVMVCGVDNGDGELVIAEATLNENDIVLRALELSNDHATTGYAVWSEEVNDKGIVGRLGRSRATNQSNSDKMSVYTNFKKIPGTDAEEHYFGSDVLKKKKRNPPYRELMSMSFGELVENAVYYYRDTVIDSVSDIYLFVGRPSSAKWQASELEYKKYLMACLPDIDNKNYTGKADKKYHFHVIVISEAMAAMANEYRENPDLCKGTVAIVDGGSSTFDCVVVQKGRVVCEYSRQIGANMLDKNLLDLVLFGKETDKPYREWKKREREREMIYAERDRQNRPRMQNTMGSDLVKVRGQKEDFYGPGGTDGEFDAEIKLYELNPETQKPLKKSEEIANIIDIAIKNMPVDVRPSYDLEENDPYGGSEYVSYSSFEKALEAFFRGAKAKWEKHGVKQPDQIIVTGGATLMPFVNELMNDIFEVKKRRIKVTTQEDKQQERRSYSVAYGTAYMGYVELYKQQIYREVKANCERMLDEVKEALMSAIVDSYSEFRWELLCIHTKQWLDDSKCESLQDWSDIHLSASWGSQLPKDLAEFLMKSRWELPNSKSVIETLNQILKEKTKAIFKDACDYSYRITDAQITAISTYNPTMYFEYNLFMGGILSRWINGFTIGDAQKKYSYSQKKTMYENITSKNSSDVRAEIKRQAKTTLESIREDIYKEILNNLDESIQQYVEGLTGYFLMEDFNAG